MLEASHASPSCGLNIKDARMALIQTALIWVVYAVGVALLSSGRISVPSSSESRPRTVHGFRILF